MIDSSHPAIVPCELCGAIGAVHTRETSPRYAVQCPNRRRRGERGEEIKGCENTATHYRCDAKRAIYYWNTLQMGVQRHAYNELMDTKAHENAPRCSCGLLLPCSCSDTQPAANRPARRTASVHGERQAKPERVVFAPMDPLEFAAKESRWLARQQRDPNRGAPTPEAQAKFQAHHDKMRLARADQRARVYESKAPRDWMES